MYKIEHEGKIICVSSLEGYDDCPVLASDIDPPRHGYCEIEELRQKVWDLVKVLREEKQKFAPTTYGLAKSDEKSRGFINGFATEALIAKMSNDTNYQRKFTMENDDEPVFDADEMLDFGKQVAAHINAVHQHSRLLYEAIKDPNITLDELADLDVESGWPE